VSEAPDPLDAELSALRPCEISPDFRRRVAGRLAGPPVRGRWVWGVALAGALATAGGLALVAAWRREPTPPGPPVVPAPPAAVESEDVAPTLMAYHRALARSPEDLDALLDRSAAGPNAEPARPPAGMFPRFAVTSGDLPGDD
jgi:hypothetical protein